MVNLRLVLLKLFYSVTLIVLTVYTYSQIDLNLTLSSNPIYQNIQKQLILLGYYNRPVSTIILSVLFSFLFLNYYLIERLIKTKDFKLADFIHMLLITVCILIFAYPAFSYDIFNYIFDARIAVKYGLNPYNFRALDFPSDAWIRFMHWTHRTYPYGPVWLLLTIPVYLAGFGKFILTLLNFKILFAASYLISIYYLNKILICVKSDTRLVQLAYFAFNPLVIIESIVSPHNEIVMLLGVFIGLYLFLGKKTVSTYLAFIISGGIKFLSWAIIPLIIFYKKWTFDKLVKIIYIVELLLLIPVVYLREPYPWYFVTLIGISSLIKSSRLITFFTLALSFGTLFRYLPFIYFGDYGTVVKNLEAYLTFGTLFIAMIYYLWSILKLKSK